MEYVIYAVPVVCFGIAFVAYLANEPWKNSEAKKIDRERFFEEMHRRNRESGFTEEPPKRTQDVL